MSFYDVIKILTPKICPQNDVTKFFHFQAPPLAKFWLRSEYQQYKLSTPNGTVEITDQ